MNSFFVNSEGVTESPSSPQLGHFRRACSRCDREWRLGQAACTCGSLEFTERYIEGTLLTLEDRTALVVARRTAFAEDNWGSDEPWAGAFGPVVSLADLCGQVSGVEGFLTRIAARAAPDDSDQPEPPPPVVAPVPPKGDLDAFFAWFGAGGVEARRRVVVDGQSAASKRLKAMARERGITAGQLWHAANEFRRSLAVHDGEKAVLHGHVAVFNQWRTVDDPLAGAYLQRFAPGAFAKTIGESRGRMVCEFQHGRDAQLGHKALGPIARLEEDDDGLAYSVPLSMDDDDIAALAPWLSTGAYGGSLSFEITADDFVVHPGRSLHNPRGLSEQTVRSIRLQEFGPVHPPAFAGTTARIRWHT